MLRLRMSGLLLPPLAALALLCAVAPVAHAVAIQPRQAPGAVVHPRPAPALRTRTLTPDLASRQRVADAAPAQPLLAVEAPGGNLPGPEPNPATTFRPQEYHAPWTWWMGVLLTASTVLAIGAYALGYYLLVYRRRQRQRVPQT